MIYRDIYIDIFRYIAIYLDISRYINRWYISIYQIMIYNRYISKKLWKFSIYVAHIDISNKKLYHDISSFVINIYERYIKIYHLPKYIIIKWYIDISKHIMIYHNIFILTILFQILRHRLQSSLILHQKFKSRSHQNLWFKFVVWSPWLPIYIFYSSKHPRRHFNVFVRVTEWINIKFVFRKNTGTVWNYIVLTS